jgi:ribosome-binding factor A
MMIAEPTAVYYTTMRDEHAGHRHTRLQQILEEELQLLVRDELTDPRLEDMKVTTVELSVDYRSARVKFVTSAPEETADKLAKIDRALQKATSFLRARLSESVEMKRLPELHFVYDRDFAAQRRAAQVMREEKP